MVGIPSVSLYTLARLPSCLINCLVNLSRSRSAAPAPAATRATAAAQPSFTSNDVLMPSSITGVPGVALRAPAQFAGLPCGLVRRALASRRPLGRRQAVVIRREDVPG